MAGYFYPTVAHQIRLTPKSKYEGLYVLHTHDGKLTAKMSYFTSLQWTEDTDIQYLPLRAAQTEKAADFVPIYIDELSAGIDDLTYANHIYQRYMYNMGSIPEVLNSFDHATPDYNDGGVSLGSIWDFYRQNISAIFCQIESDLLEAASVSLLNLSNWLENNIEDLGTLLHCVKTSRMLDDSIDFMQIGLVADNEGLSSDKVDFWNYFNYAWLGLGQKQIQLMGSRNISNIMSKDTIYKIGNKLIQLCDKLEPYALVDYQYGVWEENITRVLEDCLDLYPNCDTASAAPITDEMDAR